MQQQIPRHCKPVARVHYLISCRTKWAGPAAHGYVPAAFGAVTADITDVTPVHSIHTQGDRAQKTSLYVFSASLVIVTRRSSHYSLDFDRSKLARSHRIALGALPRTFFGLSGSTGSVTHCAMLFRFNITYTHTPVRIGSS